MVRLRLNAEFVFACPRCLGSEVLHQQEGHVDVRAGDDVAGQGQGKPVFQCRGYHKQCRDVLRTHVARQGDVALVECRSRDAERREAFVLYIFDVSAQFAKGIYQDADGTLLHAFGASEDAGSRCDGEICREETHGRTGSLDVDGFAFFGFKGL